jgi:hypothetical protein
MYWRSGSPCGQFGESWRAKIIGVCVMLVKRPKPEFERVVVLEDLATRKKRQAAEGSVAAAEYRIAQQSVLERMKALRRERLAQSSKESG